jgi:hypothetical protein
MHRPLRSCAVLAALALGLAACHRAPQPPGDIGVCYHLASVSGGAAKFNVVARNVPDMEHCAAALEGVRLRFLSLGGTNEEIAGAYQGDFLFLSQQGVFTADSYDGPRYPFLVRSGNQLVPPGSAPQ